MVVKKKILVFLLAVLTVAAMMPLIGEPACASNFDIPEADVTYGIGGDDPDWVGTLVINENKTVKISSVTHKNDETSYYSAIKVCGNSTVNLVFEGENVLSGNSSKISAGIEVESGSTVNIYGKDGSSLKVTGGQYSAGIGGIGYGSVSATNPTAGNINIYSGNITAIGGKKGAGIGSGYHSSASDINIKGGNVTALGTGGGAGIGTGYGTSGGAAEAAGAGFYNGGNITISGGTVRAAGYHLNFDNFDQYNPESLYGEGYSDTFAAGIGGGYGASSGNIIIKGNADVIALGACGGAGIGTGRGTSKSANFDSEIADCSVTIKGTSKVVAMASKDTRGGSYTPEGGAAIGLGRGWNFEGNPKGTVTIEEKANVYAYSDCGTNAIGASRTVGNVVIKADLKSLTIENSATVVAISSPVDNMDCEAIQETASGLSGVIELVIGEDYYSKNPEFFTEDKFPLKIQAVSTENENVNALFFLNEDTKYVAVHLPEGVAEYFMVKDDKSEDGKTILLTNGEEAENWKFVKDSGQLKKYDLASIMVDKYNIKYNLNGGKNASANPSEYSVLDKEITFASPTRSGYVFEGWYDNAGLSGSKVTGIKAGTSGDQEFWAKWTKSVSAAKKVSVMKVVAKGKTKGKLTWNKVSGADRYVVYFSKCGKNNYKAVKKLSASKTTWTKKGLKAGKCYKFYVAAQQKVNGKYKTIAASKKVHFAAGNASGRFTNPKSVIVKKTKVTVAKGKTAKIKATVKKVRSGKKLMAHTAKLRYTSTDPSIAAVSAKGKITGKKAGKCKIYVQAGNGVWKAVKVTVK